MEIFLAYRWTLNVNGKDLAEGLAGQRAKQGLWKSSETSGSSDFVTFIVRNNFLKVEGNFAKIPLNPFQVMSVVGKNPLQRHTYDINRA
jgi:hypothetical protein